jgi:hydrogenase maturation protein HypF
MSTQRLHLTITGLVQGVGFRPFVYNLAKQLNLVGWVKNTPQGVSLEVEGEQVLLILFKERLVSEAPRISQIDTLKDQWLEPANYGDFTIKSSSLEGKNSAHILPDLSTCPDCLQELFDPTNRRYRYPFINCTKCGPRYTIIESLPYDRGSTSMRDFKLCQHCKAEYEDPNSRRFHAQPNACHVCGPQLSLLDSSGQLLAEKESALQGAIESIMQGQILALKAFGGFQLMVDAQNPEALLRLRKLKNRPDKPFALLYPNLTMVRLDCQVSPQEAEILESPAAPIVLLKPHKISHFPTVGVMLPSTGLHHLLSQSLSFPIVATSGNLGDEAICANQEEALARLGGLCDLFLSHNRPIVQALDDSVVRVMGNHPVVLRQARGYAPLTLKIKDSKEPIQTLALGAQQKNCIALRNNDSIILSGHIGDLQSLSNFQFFKKTIDHLGNLYHLSPQGIACDAHQDYVSNQFAHSKAQSLNLPILPVQHHYAHVLSCLVDNQIDFPVLGVAWDGTGYGLDGTIWGSEFLQLLKAGQWKRVAHLRAFPLPRGEECSKNPRLSALGLLWECWGDVLFKCEDIATLKAFTAEELVILLKMLKQKLNTPYTCSMGRLFDAVASILDIEQIVSFSGQAPMKLEALCQLHSSKSFYHFTIDFNNGQIDWRPMIDKIFADLEAGVSLAQLSVFFHNSLAEMVVQVAQFIGISQVLLTGGCFENCFLLERTIERLEEEGFKPYWHHQIPPNDGGIAAGQVMAIDSRL